MGVNVCLFLGLPTPLLSALGADRGEPGSRDEMAGWLGRYRERQRGREAAVCKPTD